MYQETNLFFGAKFEVVYNWCTAQVCSKLPSLSGSGILVFGTTCANWKTTLKIIPAV